PLAKHLQCRDCRQRLARCRGHTLGETRLPVTVCRYAAEPPAATRCQNNGCKQCRSAQPCEHGPARAKLQARRQWLMQHLCQLLVDVIAALLRRARADAATVRGDSRRCRFRDRGSAHWCFHVRPDFLAWFAPSCPAGWLRVAMRSRNSLRARERRDRKVPTAMP